MMQNNEQEQEEVVRWEELMPKTVLRVLLVEPDFSTRQILTALLRKCNYQVAPIADGLQAWEILKRRHNSIDLILTELDLPSISGFALLTLIMEHDGCKNIPVVVTSSQDCISMVLNCMLKGAADFLIKPIRKNELKNLWRHVWRRLSINDGLHAQNPATEQQKVKATFEKNSATDHSGDNASTSRKRIQFSENKGSVSIVRTEDGDRSSTGFAAEHGSVGHTNDRCNNDSDILRPAEESGCCREAMDLIGSMNNRKGILVQGTSNGEFGSLDSIPELKLSLSLLHDSETTKEVDEGPALNHSNVSAFSWYDSNKESQSSCLLSIRDLTDIKGITEASPQPETHDIILGDKPSTGSQSVLDMGVWKGYALNFQPILSSLKGLGPESAAKSPNSAFCREDSPYFTSYSLHSDPGTLSSTVNNSSGEAGDGLGNRDSVDRYGYSSCNKFVDQKITLSGSASDRTEGNTDSPASALEKTVKEESCITNFELGQFRHKASLYSAEREAALARFRLKRKGRCFDKKVRYQSRKNLAEQRPRVKGQFVRHVPIDQMVIDHIKLG